MVDSTVEFISSLKVDTTHNFLDLFNGLTLKILCKTAMGHDIDFDHGDARQYREDVETMKQLLRVRSNNPIFWFKTIWDWTIPGIKQHRLIQRMYKFTKTIISKRIDEFRSLDAEEMEEIKNEYNSGKIKRKLAFLDTLIYAMDVKKVKPRHIFDVFISSKTGYQSRGSSRRNRGFYVRRT